MRHYTRELLQAVDDQPVVSKRKGIGTMTNSPDCEVIIIGAGPYGLSSAAHLRASGIEVGVFGEPMEFWAKKMPAGMLLRSPREASTISDPRSKCTLEAYEAQSGTKPAARVARETFVDYGKWFQTQLGSDLDRRNVAELRPGGLDFQGHVVRPGCFHQPPGRRCSRSRAIQEEPQGIFGSLAFPSLSLL